MRLSIDDQLSKIDRVSIVGCGTSFYAGLVAKYAIEHWTRMPCEVDVASGVPLPRSGPCSVRPRSWSASASRGESLDTMEAIRFARSASVNKAKVLTRFANVVDSSMAREADAVLYTHAGPGDRCGRDQDAPRPDRGHAGAGALFGSGTRYAASLAKSRQTARNPRDPCPRQGARLRWPTPTTSLRWPTRFAEHP